LSSRSAAPGNVVVEQPTPSASLRGVPHSGSVTPERIMTTDPVSQVLSFHGNLLGATTKSYSLAFPAREGFRIVEARFEETSATRVSNFAIYIEPYGKRAVVRFSLTSGPAVDRYRGWVQGNLVLTQERVPDLLPEK